MDWIDLAQDRNTRMVLVFVRASGPHFLVGADSQIGRTRS